MDKLGPYELNSIITGDARELAKAIPGNSVDLIFTDPVYDRIEDYEWLAETAVRVLKDGGNLLVQSNKEMLPEKLFLMNKHGLVWLTILAEVFSRSCGTIGRSKTMKGWQPYLWFSSGKRLGQWCFDRHLAKRDRRLHKWGDSTDLPLVYIQRLTQNSNIILDPFTGGGTIPAVCKMLNRQYLSFEIDPQTADLARQRVANTQPPLPLVYPEQLEIALGNRKQH